MAKGPGLMEKMGVSLLMYEMDKHKSKERNMAIAFSELFFWMGRKNVCQQRTCLDVRVRTLVAALEVEALAAFSSISVL